jgi:hypothetical protein
MKLDESTYIIVLYMRNVLSKNYITLNIIFLVEEAYASRSRIEFLFLVC